MASKDAERLSNEPIRVAIVEDDSATREGMCVLIISVNTVRDDVRSIYDKLHVHSKSEAVSKALRTRLIY